MIVKQKNKKQQRRTRRHNNREEKIRRKVAREGDVEGRRDRERGQEGSKRCRDREGGEREIKERHMCET